jgi:cobalamin biosynthesis Mg chelatase CobN
MDPAMVVAEETFMKFTNLSMLALSLVLSSQIFVSAQAAVNVSREDKSPTALQNSGATYDENNTVNAKVGILNQRPTDVRNDHSVGNARTVTDTRANIVNSNPTELRSSGVAMNTFRAQEQQQVSDTHSSAPWLLLLFAAIVVGAIYYMFKRRDQPAKRY